MAEMQAIELGLGGHAVGEKLGASLGQLAVHSHDQMKWHLLY